MKLKIKIVISFLLISTVSFCQETEPITHKDSILFEALKRNIQEQAILLKKVDSLSRIHDSLLLEIQGQSFDFVQLKNEKKKFDAQYRKQVSSANFPNTLPIKNIDKSQIIGFGKLIHPIFKIKKDHDGIDIPTFKGDTVWATLSGEVKVKELKKFGFGYHVIIESDDQVSTLFAHLNSINVNKGDIVQKGQPIGTVGSTGTSTSNHLHYQIYINDVIINPILAVFHEFSIRELEVIYLYNTETMD